MSDLANLLSNLHILTLLLVLPLIGAIITFLTGGKVKLAKILALAFSAVTLFLATLLMLAYPYGQATSAFDFSFVDSIPWIKSLGISYAVGVDGISVPMVFLTSLLCFLAAEAKED